ncbi:PTS lactose/cellobiose transporter subunit IIA [Bacillus cytotoxicus]|uniref:PTS system, cellobiose-specific IIA component n=2 Tax=Bacillus cytotoxicus TaxID=580165 RepID=A0AAX2CMX1_9BACI|nr:MULTISPECIES: PTS lactose/cellobiose transporter subunit IIA [Bacillus cereus group]ABS23947.1 phosphotransferase system PTS lactose/cellobiose-specific IIA subunit [Bacillus cytotoxicus NVH 391-98]AWC30514.1 PTS lactose/cellobiose transporter subunit IIA [Bacillus cytotoxicus]AWC34569.1 PTS lactose/cellobiose transporter subunit IIA [Bacillus cytotoxicus]AWC38567.1 PTS lactose/cellobiose transporter subunit IIA [Bacillus cytotoxicus]AWC42656.1 PTS lactose/cellobiose transporter subunit IIA
MDTLETQAFHLILHGGNARSYAMEAISHAKHGEFEEAEANIQKALQELQKAHSLQTDLIQREAGGDQTKVTLLMVHAQDHLMNAITVKELASEFIALYKKIAEE